MRDGIDLSKFPTFDGKVVAISGTHNTYLYPKVGDPLHLDIAKFVEAEHVTLMFNPQSKTYVAMSGPMRVEYLWDYGQLLEVKLTSKPDPVSQTVIEFQPKGGDAKTAIVWIRYVMKDATMGVIGVEGHYVGSFPAKPATQPTRN